MNTITNKQFFVVKSSETKFNFILPIDWSVNYEYVCVSSVSIPKTYYALPQDAKMTITVDTVPTTETIPAGNYNPRSLKNKILEKFSLLTMTIDYPNAATQTDTNKYTITFTGATQASIQCSSIYLAHMLGISAADLTVEGVVDGSDIVWTSPICLDFQSHNAILIKSTMTENSQSILQEVFTNGNPYNTNIVWQCNDLLINAKPLKKVRGNLYDFELVDEENQTMNLNSATFVMTLCVFRTTDLDNIIREYIKLRVTE